jgi:hypothetical protein
MRNVGVSVTQDHLRSRRVNRPMNPSHLAGDEDGGTLLEAP